MGGLRRKGRGREGVKGEGGRVWDGGGIGVLELVSLSCWIAVERKCSVRLRYPELKQCFQACSS